MEEIRHGAIDSMFNSFNIPAIIPLTIESTRSKSISFSEFSRLSFFAEEEK